MDQTIQLLLNSNSPVVNKNSYAGASAPSDTMSASDRTTVDFSSYLNSNKSLTQIFEQASAAYGVSVNLLTSMAKQESGFNPNATSRSGAQGVMQLMPATASSLGVTDAYDPYQNIMGGAKYISQLLARYNGNTSLALAAYNAGNNKVDQYGGIPPYTETQNYVSSILGYMQNGVSVPDATYATANQYKGTSAVTYDNLNDLAGQIVELAKAMKSKSANKILSAKLISESEM